MRLLLVAMFVLWPAVCFGQNAPPPTPPIVSPDGTELVCTWQPTFVLQNVDDPDGDTVSYFLEVDTDPCFCTAMHQSSGPIELEPGDETRWLLPRPFGLGSPPPVTHYVRRWASDGSLDSAEQVTQYEVDPACTPGGEGAAADGGAGAGAGGCHVSPGAAPAAPAMLVLLAALGIALVRRRARGTELPHRSRG